MKRLKSLTEDINIIRHSVETISQELDSHSSQMTSMTTSINNFVSQTKQDRKVLQDALNSDLREVQLSIVSVKDRLTNLAIEVQKQDNNILSHINIKHEDVLHEVKQIHMEIENTTKSAIAPLWTQVEQITHTIEGNKQLNIQSISNLQQQLNNQKSSIISEYLNPEISKLEKQIIQNDKQTKKDQFALSSLIEKQQETLDLSVKKLSERLSMEETTRADSETHLLKLLSETMTRIRSGMEK